MLLNSVLNIFWSFSNFIEEYNIYFVLMYNLVDFMGLILLKPDTDSSSLSRDNSELLDLDKEQSRLMSAIYLNSNP